MAKGEMLVVTSDEVPGRNVVKTLGLVRGQSSIQLPSLKHH